MDIALISLLGMEEFTNKIKMYIEKINSKGHCEVVDVNLLRFSTGDGKAVLQNTLRGKDAYIIMDVGNYKSNYTMYGREVIMSPDEHFQDLKRIVSAIGGKADRINVISPMLYSARQDRRISRESLDCAVALRELENIGIKNIMAFDVHDDRVQNAVPFMGFDNLMPIYQTIKALKKAYPEIIYDEEHMMLISPDFGATNRNLLYSNELGLEMGIFYKRRSRHKLINGKYPMEVHQYIGPGIKGKDVLFVDDIIASGETMLDAIKKAKQYGAKRIFVAATFGLFTEGVEKYTKAYNEGVLDAVFITNGTYRSDEVIQAPWYKEVDITKYVAYYVFCVNTGKSISVIMDPHEKISRLFDYK
jgi:ribose-phosphate pyrophosphokinase